MLFLPLALALTSDEKQSIKPAWSTKDSAAETEMIQDSYKNLDHVQDELIDAAKREMAETKSLPTLAQATHHWHMGDDFVAQPEKSSFAETAEKKPDSVGDVDFSKLDGFRSKLERIHQNMNGDIERLKAQTASDEQFAEQTAKLAHEAPQPVSALEKQAAQDAAFERAKKALVAHEIAKYREVHAKQHAQEMQHHLLTGRADARLSKAQSALEKLEQVMEARHVEMGSAETPEAKFARQKIEQLLALSRQARTVMDSVDAGGAVGTKEHLAQIEKVKEQIEALKGHVHGHLVDHLGLMNEAVQDHVSFVQQRNQEQPETYGKIAENLSSLQSRIQGQIAALKTAAAKENEQQVEQLSQDSVPSAIAVDPLGNMRIDK